jgi:hypothetical protein
MNNEVAALTYLILVRCPHEIRFPIPSYFGYIFSLACSKQDVYICEQ